MKRKYHPYNTWEDYKNGMYSYNKTKNDEVLIKKAVALLRDTKQFNTVSRKMIKRWPVSAAENLSNINSNRKAWIGQASCSYYHNVPEILTRVAWGYLTDDEKELANNIALNRIKEYERKNNGPYTGMGKQVLF